MNRLILLIFFISLSDSLFANLLSDIKNEGHHQLVTSDRLLANTMHLLQLSYINNKFNTPNQTLCYDSTTCSALTESGVSNLTLALPTLDDNAYIASITYGFIPPSNNNGESSCSDTSLSSIKRTRVDSSGFSSCSYSAYANHLAIEVRFKSSTYFSSISGVLDNKSVLFLAKGPGAHSQFIVKSDNLPIIHSIGNYACVNNDGKNFDGLNNGSRMGSILLQNKKRPILSFVSYGQPIGGFSTCLQ